MEARVDLNKLQILNDRISQTIDALNQVRMSVRSVTAAPGIVSTYGSQSGFQHSSPWYGGVQSGAPWNPLQSVSPIGMSYTGVGLTPYASFLPQGLQHSSADIHEWQLAQLRAQDAYRVAQTFPFAFTTL